MRGYDRETTRMIPIRPDGYMELMWPNEAFTPFFIEVDMGTETNARVERKLRAYRDLRREMARNDLRIQRFYLLIVTSGQRRMDNLQRIAKKAVGRGVCFFATLEDLRPARVLAAWHNVDNRVIRLIGSFREESSGEESQQRDAVEKEDEGDDDGYDGGYYDDEDKETWPE